MIKRQINSKKVVAEYGGIHTVGNDLSVLGNKISRGIKSFFNTVTGQSGAITSYKDSIKDLADYITPILIKACGEQLFLNSANGHDVVTLDIRGSSLVEYFEDDFVPLYDVLRKSITSDILKLIDRQFRRDSAAGDWANHPATSSNNPKAFYANVCEEIVKNVKDKLIEMQAKLHSQADRTTDDLYAIYGIEGIGEAIETLAAAGFTILDEDGNIVAERDLEFNTKKKGTLVNDKYGIYAQPIVNQSTKKGIEVKGAKHSYDKSTVSGTSYGAQIDTNRPELSDTEVEAAKDVLGALAKKKKLNDVAKQVNYKRAPDVVFKGRGDATITPDDDNKDPYTIKLEDIEASRRRRRQ